MKNIPLLYEREIVNVDLLCVLAVDNNSMRHASGDLFQIIQYESIGFHDAAASISLQKFVWMVAVEKDFSVPTS